MAIHSKHTVYNTEAISTSGKVLSEVQLNRRIELGHRAPEERFLRQILVNQDCSVQVLVQMFTLSHN